jgi:hypothetical protein
MSKIVAVVTDNVANILRAIKYILKLKQLCFAQTLSLAIQIAPNPYS